MKTCQYCGEYIKLIGVETDPIPDVPELKKKLYFCSSSCYKRFIESIKASRKKDAKSKLRAQLESKTKCSMESSEIFDIQSVLTAKEKFIVEAYGIMALLERNGDNPQQFFQRLRSLKGN